MAKEVRILVVPPTMGATEFVLKLTELAEDGYALAHAPFDLTLTVRKIPEVLSSGLMQSPVTILWLEREDNSPSGSGISPMDE